MKAFLLGLCLIVSPINAASLPDVIDKVLPSVVIVKAKLPLIPILVDKLSTTPTIHTGAGFFVAPNLILTSYHIIKGAEEVRISLYGNLGVQHTVIVVGYDPYLDIALLQSSSIKGSPIEWGTCRNLRAGQQVFAIGNPYGYEFSTTIGIISHTERRDPKYSFVRYLQTDAAVNKGNSGGPIFNREGKAIGIIQAIISVAGGSDGIALAVESDLLIPSIMRIYRDKGKIRRPSIGLGIHRYIPEYHKMFNSDFGLSQGLIVHDVTAHGPAMLAGLLAGDLILKVNGTKFRESYALIDFIQLFEPGDKLTITVLRRHMPQDIVVTLGTIGN